MDLSAPHPSARSSAHACGARACGAVRAPNGMAWLACADPNRSSAAPSPDAQKRTATRSHADSAVHVSALSVRPSEWLGSIGCSGRGPYARTVMRNGMHELDGARNSCRGRQVCASVCAVPAQMWLRYARKGERRATAGCASAGPMVGAHADDGATLDVHECDTAAVARYLRTNAAHNKQRAIDSRQQHATCNRQQTTGNRQHATGDL